MIYLNEILYVGLRIGYYVVFIPLNIWRNNVSVINYLLIIYNSKFKGSYQNTGNKGQFVYNLPSRVLNIAYRLTPPHNRLSIAWGGFRKKGSQTKRTLYIKQLLIAILNFSVMHNKFHSVYTFIFSTAHCTL